VHAKAPAGHARLGVRVVQELSSSYLAVGMQNCSPEYFHASCCTAHFSTLAVAAISRVRHSKVPITRTAAVLVGCRAAQGNFAVAHPHITYGCNGQCGKKNRHSRVNREVGVHFRRVKTRELAWKKDRSQTLAWKAVLAG